MGAILLGIIATTFLAAIFHKMIPEIPALVNNPTVQNSMLMTRFRISKDFGSQILEIR